MKPYFIQTMFEYVVLFKSILLDKEILKLCAAFFLLHVFEKYVYNKSILYVKYPFQLFGKKYENAQWVILGSVKNVQIDGQSRRPIPNFTLYNFRFLVARGYFCRSTMTRDPPPPP